jgi:4-hydroxy-3-methylbut-2-enyl diphosphate reductase
LGEQCGLSSYLVRDETELQAQWFRNGIRVGVTAGASAPETLVARVIEHLNGLGASSVRSIGGIVENTVFKMPQELVDAADQLKVQRA